MSKTIERIEREAGIPGLVELLAERLSPTDLQSVLLEVFREQARRKQPAAVLADHENNRFARPSLMSPLNLLAWEQTAFANLPPEFQPIALSPVTALGACSAVGLVDQNKVLSTIRNTEVVADSTNVLALECALKRKQLLRTIPKSAEPVHLAASHRLLRTQQYDNPRSIPHFSAFALCSAGRDQGNLQFELSAFTAHILFYLRSLRAFAGRPMRVAVTNFDATLDIASLTAPLFACVIGEFPEVDCGVDEQRSSGRDYYVNLCFHVYAENAAGEELELADGGVVNWTQKLLNSAKERCVISGIGSERVCAEFGISNAL